MFRSHSGNYKVRVGHLPAPWLENHPLGGNSRSWDLLLIQPDVVGGYMTVGEGAERLVIMRDAHKYRRAAEIYQAVVNRTIAFEKGRNYEDLRAAWLGLHKIGHMHIRCWVPDYLNLIDRCAELVKLRIAHMLRDTSGQIAIIEIGYGTGALSMPILDWLDKYRPYQENAPIRRFVGVDAADRMRSIARNRFNGHWPNVDWKLELGTAFGNLPPTIGSESFDVACGSLVFHDFIGRKVSSGIYFLRSVSAGEQRTLRPSVLRQREGGAP